jgi:hypothetical protein
MKIQIVIIFLFVFLFFSCNKDEIKIDPNNLLIGVWNHTRYSNDVSVYSRSREFINGYGYQFNSDGTLTERKLAGWCATPPVSYSDYAGTWAILNDTTITITDGYWGGITTYKLKIRSVTADSLRIIHVYENK